MTNANMAPERGARRRHQAGDEDGDCCVRLMRHLSSFMHDYITGRLFLDSEPVLFCTNVSRIRLAAANINFKNIFLHGEEGIVPEPNLHPLIPA